MATKSSSGPRVQGTSADQHTLFHIIFLLECIRPVISQGVPYVSLKSRVLICKSKCMSQIASISLWTVNQQRAEAQYYQSTKKPTNPCRKQTHSRARISLRSWEVLALSLLQALLDGLRCDLLWRPWLFSFP